VDTKFIFLTSKLLRRNHEAVMSKLLKTCRFFFLKDYPARWPRLFMSFYPRSRRVGG